MIKFPTHKQFYIRGLNRVARYRMDKQMEKRCPEKMESSVPIMAIDAEISAGKALFDDKIVNKAGSTSTSLPSQSFTTEELDAVREAKKILLTKHKMRPDQISIRELIIVTMNCKLRPDTAADKYKKWLELIDTGMGVKSFDMVWSEIGIEGKNLVGHRLVSKLTKTFAGCGRDIADRSIMWIRTQPVPIEDEADAILASIIYFTAVHADLRSLREGITFVLDTTTNSMEKLHGNENKLQRTWQSIPLRPQRIFILGCNLFKRLAINALLAIASLFTKEKVLQRVLFATMDDVAKEVNESSLPVSVGGGAGGIITDDDLIAWIQSRLQNFPSYAAADL